MPKTTPQGQFPFDKDTFTVTLYEEGNAPDYSFIYNIGVQAGRGFSESYTINNAPKNLDHMQVEITCNPDTDSTRFNYMKIDYLDRAGGGAYNHKTRYFFIQNKTILNYPDYDPIKKIWGGYAVLFDCELDIWETYKDFLGTPTIYLSKVTTSEPESWGEIGVLGQSVLPFSDIDVSYSDKLYDDYKTVIAWQAKKPTAQDTYIIDDMQTFLQFNDNGNVSDYLADLEDLASEPPQATNLFKTYVVAKSYILPNFFATQNGQKSDKETISCFVPTFPSVHRRLLYPPYIRGFLCTIDGQRMEVDYNKMLGHKLINPFTAEVHHSTVPEPTSVIYPDYVGGGEGDCLIFNQYPSMDMAGRTYTPQQQILAKYNRLDDSQVTHGG